MAQTPREKELNDLLYGNAVNYENAEKPEYAGTYEGRLNELFDQISNRDKFSYDVSKDPLYGAYKDEYIQQGKLAMKDTMGQAAALTGGYGNTYGQQVGQQAYDAYLQKLSAAIPELYGMAYKMYQDEGDQLKDLYGMVGAQRDAEYGRYRDDLSDWEYGQNVLRQMEQQEYSRRMDEEAIARQLEQQEYERRIYEEEVQRKLEQQAWERQQQAYSNLYAIIKASGYAPSDAELQAAGMSREQAAQLASEFNRQILNEDLERDYRMYGGSGGSSGGGSSGGGRSYSGGGGSSYDYDYDYDYDYVPAASTGLVSAGAEKTRSQVFNDAKKALALGKENGGINQTEFNQVAQQLIASGHSGSTAAGRAKENQYLAQKAIEEIIKKNKANGGR